MITIRHERPPDVAAREALLDRCLGPARWQKCSQRLRDGRLPAAGLAFVAVDRGRVVGTVRLWNVAAGRARPALLLGPLAVDPAWRGRGIGAALMRRALDTAARLGHAAVLLVGDAAYYGRFGFRAEPTAALRMPGKYERARFLALELTPGALNRAAGLIEPTGRRIPSQVPAEAVALETRRRQAGNLPQAA